MAFISTKTLMEISMFSSRYITLLIFILSVIGLVTIYVSVINIKPLELKIESIEDSMIDRVVKIDGKIENIRKSKTGNFYWTVGDGDNITVPILDDKFKKLDVKSGDSVEILGLVTKYNDELEVMPKEIYVK
jgi:DNA/RNA endonuclease YhcR with UshA esterase domain